MAENDTDNQLLSLKENSKPPETRVATAMQARSIFNMLVRADTLRSPKRGLVKGLVDGNPPYRQGDLDAAGRSGQCNVNWRVSESYFNGAVGAFYDLFNEAPTYATVRLKSGTPEQREQWSKCATVHFDWLCRYEPLFDYYEQKSENEMVLYGRGPRIFPDELDWKPIALLDCELKVPERTKSDVALWELACVEIDYLPHELWERIFNDKEAREVGWNVQRVRQAIIEASPDSAKGGLYRTWEWHQQQLKNGSLSYSYSSRTISTAHLFFKEFRKQGEKEGKVSHVIIIAHSSDADADKFLFQKTGRYDNWYQCIHPMYYDRGGGGFHHSVTGMGIKMYSAMEFQNRLLCNQADKAFAPKIMFKPTTASQAEQFAITQMTDYAILPEGFDMIQTPIHGAMEEGMVFNREITNLIASNLSQYRTNTSEPIKGNPDTATKVRLDASKEASLQKTQMNRYYNQKDALYAEMYRRAVQSGVTDPRAKEFVERCKKDGVPANALREVEFVKASRVVGQGSEFLRQQSTEFLFGTVLPMLPESGRTNLIDDVIASRAGYSMVERYNPRAEQNKLPSDQEAIAWGQVADMKIGVPAIVTETQNSAIFAPIFIQAASDALGTLEQGANPQDVAAFLELCGQAIARHLQRLAQDPSRKQLYDVLEEQFQEIARIQNQLVQKIQQDAENAEQEQMAAMDRQRQMTGDFELDRMKLQGDLALKKEKSDAMLGMKAQSAAQKLSISDALAASKIRNASRTQKNGNGAK